MFKNKTKKKTNTNTNTKTNRTKSNGNKNNAYLKLLFSQSKEKIKKLANEAIKKQQEEQKTKKSVTESRTVSPAIQAKPLALRQLTAEKSQLLQLGPATRRQLKLEGPAQTRQSNSGLEPTIQAKPLALRQLTAEKSQLLQLGPAQTRQSNLRGLEPTIQPNSGPAQGPTKVKVQGPAPTRQSILQSNSGGPAKATKERIPAENAILSKGIANDNNFTSTNYELHQQENGTDGSCMFYSLYQSLKSLQESFFPNLVTQFNTCLGLKYVQSVNELEIQSNFNTALRELLGNKIGENIFFEVARDNYITRLLDKKSQNKIISDAKNNVERAKRQKAYNYEITLYKNPHGRVQIDEEIRNYHEFYSSLSTAPTTDEYSTLIGEYRKHFPNTLEEFKIIYKNKNLFYNKLKELVKTPTEYLNSNGYDISILNLLLKISKTNYKGYTLRIVVFYSNQDNDRIKTTINENYINKIISIPIIKMDKYPHYKSILFIKT